MIGLEKLGSILKGASKAIKYLTLVQHNERRRLSTDLKTICDKCEDSFQVLLKVSEEIRSNFGDEEKLLQAVSDFIKDDELANKFKPEHLCSEISNLLMDLNSNLSGIKYSVAINNISILQQELGSIHELDFDLRQQFYMLRNELQELCDDYRIDKKELSAIMIKDILNGFQDSLNITIQSIRTARDNIEKHM